MQIFDSLDDIQHALVGVIAEEQHIPAFVKQASEFGEAARLNKNVWAWPEEKKFPLDTPSDVYWSHHYFKKTASKLDNSFLKTKIASAIKQAVTLMGLPVEHPIKLASETIPNESFALRLKSASCSPSLQTSLKDFIRGGEICMYPLHNDNQVKMANANFPKGLDGALEPLRPMVAQKIAEKSASISPAVASYMPVSYTALCDQLNARAGMFPKFASEYNKALEFVEEASDSAKFAIVINELDKQSGAALHYGKLFKEASFFLRGLDKSTIPDRSVFDTINIKGASYKSASLGCLSPIIPGFSTLPSVEKQAAIDALHPSVLNLVVSALKG
jgi:hypothetical protein